MTREEMEFLISQHLDGTLSHEEEAKVRQLLESSAEAREILAEYQKLDVILKTSAASPAVKWEMLAEKISGAVYAVGEAQVSEEDELAITEYLDGSLSAVHRTAVDKRLNSEPGL